MPMNHPLTPNKTIQLTACVIGRHQYQNGDGYVELEFRDPHGNLFPVRNKVPVSMGKEEWDKFEPGAMYQVDFIPYDLTRTI